MLIYQSTKKGFLDAVLTDTIADEISAIYREKIGRPNPREVSAWSDSMQYMFKVLSTGDIPDGCGVAIELGCGPLDGATNNVSLIDRRDLTIVWIIGSVDSSVDRSITRNEVQYRLHQ